MGFSFPAINLSMSNVFSMPMGLLGLIAVSSLGWSLFDTFRKQLTTTYSPVSLAIWLLGAQSIFFLLLLPFEHWKIQWEPYLWPGLINILINTVADVFFLMSVQLAPLSLTVPMLSFTPLFAALGSWLLIGETLTAAQWCGVGFIVWGAILLSRKAGVHVEPHQEPHIKKAVWLMLFTALIWAVAPVLDKMCLQFTSPYLHAELQLAGVFACLLLYLRLQGKPLEPLQWRTGLMPLLLATTCFGVALIAQFDAITQMPVGLFEAVKRCLNMSLVVLLGFFVFKEKLYRRKMLSIAIMMAGVAVLLLG